MTLRHYLEIRFDGRTFLIPNAPDLLIEPRENMQDEPRGTAAATRVVQGAVWPAYALDADLKARLDAPWTRAVFLNSTAARPVGLLVEDLKLLPVDSLRIEPFTPLGPSPKTGRHLFDAAAMQPGGLTLVFATAGLISRLQNEEDAHGLAG